MNYMEQVAKMLGVELGERFRIYDDDCEYDVDYYFSEHGIYVDMVGNHCRANSGLLFDIVSGEYSIKHKPWKPKDGDEFYYVDYSGFPVCFGTEGCDPDDYINYYKLGNCYRTKKEAEANREKWKAFYASDEVLEV